MKTKGTLRPRNVAVLVACVGVMIVSSIILPVSNRLGHASLTRHDLYLVPVPQEMPDKSYWVRDAMGRTFLVMFCKSQPFDEGETIVDITFKDYETCWEPTSYRMKRDLLGNLIRENKQEE